MAMGAIRTYAYAASTSAIDKDFTISSPTGVDGPDFVLHSVTVNFNTAPATSENIVIKSIVGTVTSTELTIDPTLYGYTSYVFDFNKAYQRGTVIGVDYTNTNGRSVTVQLTYQENV
jgi:hypothetical protein